MPKVKVRLTQALYFSLGEKMTELLRRLLAKPKNRAAITGAGSVLDLGGSSKLPTVLIFHAKPAHLAVGDAWRSALGNTIEQPKTGKKR